MSNTVGCVTLALLSAGMAGLVLAQSEQNVISSTEIQEALEQPRTRGIGVRVKTKVALNIPFELNSSVLAPAAVSQLEQLEAALKQETLNNYRFEVGGHTDASGSTEYNRQLSQHRADAVRKFLIERGLSPARLDAVGYGEDRLLHVDRPQDPENRRVEIRNLGESP